MKLTVQQLCKAMPACSFKRAQEMLEPFNMACERAHINTPQRLAQFIATVGHESIDLAFMKEIASGAAYEGRKDLGNTQPGDGRRFRGRGPIQITGRDNYTKFAAWSGLDCVNKPELLEIPEHGFLASAWFWMHKGLNEIADTGNFLKVSIRVNGRRDDGLPNGWADRQKRMFVAMEALK